MKNIFILTICLWTFFSCQEKNAEQELFFVGSYTQKEGHVNGKSKGIALCSFDPQTGKINNLGIQAETTNPSFVCIHPSGKFLYAVNETGGRGETDFGKVIAYEIDLENKKLKHINSLSSGGKYPCHVSVSEDGQHLFVANYGGGLSVYTIRKDGRLSSNFSTITHPGEGVHPRQESSHIHQATGKDDLVFVNDLGIDKIVVYRVDNISSSLKKVQNIDIAPGSGPRHLCFSPNGKRIYLLNELSATINLIEQNDSLWQSVASYPSLSDKSNEGHCADIHISPDGRFLYTSNRGTYNSISVFAVNKKTGALSFIEEVPTNGKTPRNFAISPNGNYLLAANQDSSNISIFEIDKQSGKLRFLMSQKIATPVCISFLQ